MASTNQGEIQIGRETEYEHEKTGSLRRFDVDCELASMGENIRVGVIGRIDLDNGWQAIQNIGTRCGWGWECVTRNKFIVRDG